MTSNKKYTDRDNKIVEFYSAGKSLRQTAAEFSVSYGTAHKVVTEAGVMRSRGGSARKPQAA